MVMLITKIIVIWLYTVIDQYVQKYAERKSL